jgi:hypothetical protein
MQNFRLSAVNQLAKFTTSQATPTQGAEERKQLFSSSLSDVDKSRLQTFRAQDERTETDTYLVFHCKTPGQLATLVTPTDLSEKGAQHLQAKRKKNVRAPIQTDTLPLLVATHISSVESTPETTFCLPCPVVDDTKWHATLPRFNHWLFSVCRYPSSGLDAEGNPELKLTYAKSRYSTISELDVFELYSSALLGTLLEGFQCRDEKLRDTHFDMGWKLFQAMQIVFRDELKSTTKLDSELLRTRIEHRDDDTEGAKAYKQLVNSQSPTSFYTALYELSVYSYESVHRSNVIGIEQFVAGLLTPHQTCRYEGIATSLLRMALERVSKHIGPMNTSSFIDKQELVQHLTTVPGKAVQSLLRRVCFVSHAVNLISCQLARNDWMSHLAQLKTTVLSLKGMLPLCHFLDPGTKHYLTEDHIAEWILGCSQNRTRSFAVMDGTMLVSHGVSRMDRMVTLVTENIERKKSLIRSFKEDQKEDEKEDWKEDEKETPEEAWKTYCDKVSQEGSFSSRARSYKIYLANHALDDKNVGHLKALLRHVEALPHPCCFAPAVPSV